jgi:transposase-like protein
MTEKIKRYSEAFRRQVVAEYESGTGITCLQKKYGIKGGTTIQTWIKKYAKAGFRHEVVHIQTAEEVNRVKELEKQVKELEQALGQVTLEKLKLESILEEVQGVQGEEVKKNAAPLSNGSSPKLANRLEAK